MAATLAEFGVRVVAVHVVGPDMADLDYLDRFDRDLFTPEAVLDCEEQRPGPDRAIGRLRV